ncbi:MAG TPA: YegS/Rv2252/BmrU family lipid kinase [Solirubrobacteraceae bacterium]|jgi:YegS/Rv2252/BmrU family lipid kinase|nr:YegS/Rv2252/BmrU family lipid kinase [Solirubrobacteraceae bacterium]
MSVSISAPVRLIVNPAAGGGRGGRAAPAVVRALEGHGLVVRRADTRDLPDARRLALEAARGGETAVALGGDGLIGAVADALRAVPGALLGVLPGGRGNDLVRVLGIPQDPVAACATIAHGIPRPLDLGLLREARPGAPERAFVGIASVGFDSDANRIANEAPAWLGGLVYAYGALRALWAWRPARFEVELEPPGERRSFTAYTVGACNSKTYGGGMRAAPGAMLDDGLLDVVVLESVGKLTFLAKILPKVFSGTHVHDPRVNVMRAREISVGSDRPFTMYADGDPIGELPVHVRALPAAVRVLVPAGEHPDSPFSTPVPAEAESMPAAGELHGLAHAAEEGAVRPSSSPPRRRMMAGPLAPKLALARAAGALSRLRGGEATSVPGKVLMRLEPDAIGVLGERLARGSVLVSATNGKTTTAAMVASILAREGVALVHNRAGANMAGGIASTLLAATRPGGAIAGELGLFEVDELWLERVAAQLHPRAILLGNLFRDQLDRYGELETIAERWAHTVRDGPARGARLVLNADDPMVADLGRERDGVAPAGAEGDRGESGSADALGSHSGGVRGGVGVLYFGVEDDSLALPHMAHAADAKHCRNCGAPYIFEAVYLGHLGHYRCPACGQARPVPTVLATDVRLEGVRAARFTLHTPAGVAAVALPLPGLYNVYNALAAAALAHVLEIPLERIVAGLESTAAAFGRAESVMIGEPAHPRELRILLVKNPAGANEVLRTLALEPGEHDLLGVLNDNIADGRDVSWIWDADFELLAGRVRRATCSGTRAAELAVRLKYAGVELERIHVQPNLRLALREATGARPPRNAPLYALPTYTAMLSLRDLLSAGGHTRSALS